MNFPNYQDPAHRERILILVGGRDSILQALNNISAIVFVPSVAPDDLYARVGRTSGDGTAAAAGAARTAYNIATSPFRFFLKNYKTAAEDIAGKDSIGVGYVEPDLTIKQAVTEALPYALRWTGQDLREAVPGTGAAIARAGAQHEHTSKKKTVVQIWAHRRPKDANDILLCGTGNNISAAGIASRLQGVFRNL